MKNLGTIALTDIIRPISRRRRCMCNKPFDFPLSEMGVHRLRHRASRRAVV